MNNIKTYEKFIYENFNDDEYFRLLNQTESYDWLIKMIDVKQKDLDLVKSCLDDWKYDISISDWGLINNEPYTSEKAKIINYKYILAKRKGFSYKIFRLPDEWFIVILSDEINNVNLYYLCDQLDGLQHFLNKK